MDPLRSPLVEVKRLLVLRALAARLLVDDAHLPDGLEPALYVNPLGDAGIPANVAAGLEVPAGSRIVIVGVYQIERPVEERARRQLRRQLKPSL